MTHIPFVIPKVRTGRTYRLMNAADIDRVDVRDELSARGATPEDVNDFRIILTLSESRDTAVHEHFPTIELDGKTVICLSDSTAVGQRAIRLSRLNLRRAFTITHGR